MKARAVILALLGLIVLGGLTVLPAPLVVGGQQPAKVPRVGLLLIGSASTSDPVRVAQAFRQGLSERGYVEGKNIAIEQRSAEGRFDRLPGLATGLVHLKVDVIVVGATPSALAARQATKTIPIVVAAMADPVRDGLVASLARPGGNITGFTFLARELAGC